MDEYTGKQEEEEDMDISNISTQELIPLEEDEDINNFITELFNENKNNEVKNYQMKTILLFWICVNTLTYHQLKMKILLYQVSV